MNDIIKNTDTKTLFKLFKEFTNRLVKNTESLGIFSVDEGYQVFYDSDIKKVIQEMKKVE